MNHHLIYLAVLTFSSYIVYMFYTFSVFLKLKIQPSIFLKVFECKKKFRELCITISLHWIHVKYPSASGNVYATLIYITRGICLLFKHSLCNLRVMRCRVNSSCTIHRITILHAHLVVVSVGCGVSSS